VKNFWFLAMLASLAACIVMGDASAGLRRRSRPCCQIEPRAGGVSITACSCTSASGSLGTTTSLIQCYVVDANHKVYQGTVTYSYGGWSATFPDSPTPQCTCTIVGKDGSADSKACTGYSYGCCKTGGVHIDSCNASSASGTHGGARRLAECYVVYGPYDNLKLVEGDVQYDGKGGWKATTRTGAAVPTPCTWTVVGTDDSAHAKYQP
jgi:hypothetical protein